MKRTVTVTIYHNDGQTWERNVYKGCFWEDDRQRAIAKSGLRDADRLYVSLPLAKAPALALEPGKDMIVKDECPVEIDNTSQSTQSATIKELRAEYEVFTVTALSLKDHSLNRRMHHWEIGGK